MSLWEQLEARRLPTEQIDLPVGDGDTLTVEVRALPPVEWEALIGLHPPPEADQGRLMWHEPTFRPALLAACVVAPDGTQRDEQWWAGLWKAGTVTAGELNSLYYTAVRLNQQGPQARVGKD
jgi:hypothetical protein